MTRYSLWLLVGLSACAGAPEAGDAGPGEDADAGVDAGSPVDAGVFDAGGFDAGMDAGVDAGVSPDAGAAAAIATAKTNPNCVAILPFYWELGDRNGLLVSGSERVSGPAVYTATTELAIASASKWLYSTYFVQKTQAALSADDVRFFNFWSGYTHFTGCQPTNTVSTCLDITHGATTNGTLDPSTEGKFDYGGGHLQKHAAINGLGALTNSTLAAEITTGLGGDLKLAYESPQLAGGAIISAAEYAKVLRRILSGSLKMHDLLGTHAVCTNPGTCPLAISTPAPPEESWDYSVGHWLESDPQVGDGAFSSAGAFGFYPWIDASKTYYGVIARKDVGGGSGFESAKCGRLIRKAYLTGVAQ